jgi:hypothetical protein
VKVCALRRLRCREISVIWLQVTVGCVNTVQRRQGRVRQVSCEAAATAAGPIVRVAVVNVAAESIVKITPIAHITASDSTGTVDAVVVALPGATTGASSGDL